MNRIKRGAIMLAILGGGLVASGVFAGDQLRLGERLGIQVTDGCETELVKLKEEMRRLKGGSAS